MDFVHDLRFTYNTSQADICKLEDIALPFYFFFACVETLLLCRGVYYFKLQLNWPCVVCSGWLVCSSCIVQVWLPLQSNISSPSFSSWGSYGVTGDSSRCACGSYWKHVLFHSLLGGTRCAYGICRGPWTMWGSCHAAHLFCHSISEFARLHIINW